MRIYTGIDIVEIDRIADAVTRWGDHFLRRVFTPGELVDCGGRVSSLAARFAAKEAAAKALGAGLRGVGMKADASVVAAGWHEIEVARAPTGQPQLLLHGRAAEQARTLGWSSTALSLSHGRDAAVASVVAIGVEAIDVAGADGRSADPAMVK